VLQLVEEKKFTLNTRLDQLLAPSIIEQLLVINKNDYSGEITLKQLLNHTSGLAHFWDDPPYVKKGYNTFFSKFVKDENRIWHPIETLSFVPHLHPRGLPGSNFHYSDTNYVLLGMIIESIEKKPLHEVYRKRLFNRLGLKDTYMSYREKPKSRYKESHRFFEDEDLHGKEQWSADWASGGLVSSTRDLGTFILALASGGVFRSPKTLRLMQDWVDTDDNVYYGLGIYGIKLDGHKGMLWGHDGWGGAFMYYWPERDIVFTGTRNQTGSEEDDSENEWWQLIDEAIKTIESC
jgi:D-alanyl-D-alanine carboxypeptidase